MRSLLCGSAMRAATGPRAPAAEGKQRCKMTTDEQAGPVAAPVDCTVCRWGASYRASAAMFRLGAVLCFVVLAATHVPLADARDNSEISWGGNVSKGIVFNPPMIL